MEIYDGRKMPTWDDIHKLTLEYENLKCKAIKAHTILRNLKVSPLWNLLSDDTQENIRKTMSELEALDAHA